METVFNVPQREEVSAANQQIFDKIKATFGKVPNLYATMAHSENALGAYLQLQQAPSSLTAREKEVVNLVVSQVNNCIYCLSAHTLIAKNNGFTEAQTFEIRSAAITFDEKLNALAKLTQNITLTRGKADPVLIERFLEVGYTKENLVDTIVLIGDKSITNLLHSVTKVPVDFPLAKDLA